MSRGLPSSGCGGGSGLQVAPSEVHLSIFFSRRDEVRHRGKQSRKERARSRCACAMEEEPGEDGGWVAHASQLERTARASYTQSVGRPTKR